jgi:hypothetical protein
VSDEYQPAGNSGIVDIRHLNELEEGEAQEGEEGEEGEAQEGGRDIAPGIAGRFIDKGGRVISDVRVQLIFWGAIWNGNPKPSIDAITNAVSLIHTGPYMSALSQYRGIGPGSLRGKSVVASSNPPNPFQKEHVPQLLIDLLKKGELIGPDQEPQIFYCIIMPPGVKYKFPKQIGDHSALINPANSSLNVHYAWVTNDGTLDYVTTVYSHEIVEACTDPLGDPGFSAIQGVPGTCSQGGWCEIGDVCVSKAVVNNVCVQSYYSEKDRKCIIPGK